VNNVNILGLAQRWLGRVGLAGLIVVLSFSSTACGSSPAAPTAASNPSPVRQSPTAAGGVGFSANVQPIFQSRCVSCHGGGRTNAGLDLSSYASVMKGSRSGPVVVPGGPGNSLLYQMVESDNMPASGPPLTADQKETIRQWIQSGAPNN
jgi:uncharacterized membrane protein